MKVIVNYTFAWKLLSIPVYYTTRALLSCQIDAVRLTLPGSEGLDFVGHFL